MGRIALDHLHQGWHQVGAALVLVEYLGPAGVDLLILLLDLVVTAAAKPQDQDGEYDQTSHGPPFFRGQRYHAIILLEV